MGYYNYQQGLIYRHLNQDKGWISHEEHCRNFIIKALDYFKPEKVTVYGSGWLMDLPLAEMAERVDRIFLVDIIHPPEVITQTAGFKNIQLVEEDVTGGLIEEVWKKAGNRTFFNRLSSLSDISVPEYQPVDDPGLAISLNILTQLETLPEKLLRKKCRVDEKEYINFRKEIQLLHIRFLEKHKSVMILILREPIINRKNQYLRLLQLCFEMERENIMFDYKQHDGISKHLNAGILMRPMGIFQYITIYQHCG
jgi:hypothetical protein